MQTLRFTSPDARSRPAAGMSSNALDYITIKGFKSIASLEKLPLRPVNILIGPNGSGKSNFIGAFAFLRAVREGRLQPYIAAAGGAEAVLHFGSKTTTELSFHLSFGNEVNQYDLKLGATEDDSLYPLEETVRFWNKKFARSFSIGLSPTQRRREAGISSPELEDAAKWVRDRIGSWRVYHVHDTSPSSPMRKTAKLDDNEFLRSDGSNLAAFLYYLREHHSDSYQAIRHTVQRVAPFFEDFNLRPSKLNRDSIKIEWRHRGSDQYFDASSLSDGSLRFIALATLFLQPESSRPSAILVDEPELGLHPYAIGLLASLIRQASSETQVIVSSQSSLLLDYFQPQDVMVATRVDGATHIDRLDESQLEAWLDEYSLGQLWEKNEIGGRPVPD
jgi:predicted ATPase